MIIETISAALFIWLVVFAIVLDATKLTIPNWISIALIAAFFCHSLFGNRDIVIWQHLAVALTVLLVGAGLFAMRWMGGGDVKLLSAVALWAGPPKIVPFLLLASVLGA